MNHGQIDEVQELIRREKERAERSFDSARFDSRLFERIRKARERRPAAWFVFLRKPGPIVAVSALVLAVSGILLLRTFSPSPSQRTIRAMSAVLDKPGVGRGTSGQDRIAQRIATAEYTEFGWALKEVLYACERQALEDVGITDALSLVLLEGASRDSSSRDREGESSRRVESPRLRTAEDFRMFLTGFLKRFEEV